jgi:SAM-dependent methyltransferase
MAFYSDFAGYYEKIFPLREPTLAFLDCWLPEEGRILDLGCGTGHYCGRLAALGRDCLGVDLDPGMISQAEKNYLEPTFRMLGLQEVGNLKPGSFAGVYCIGNVLPHLPARELKGFLASVRTLLKPGGRWIFQTVNFDPILHVDEHRFPVLEFPLDGLTFHRKYTNTSDGTILFQTHLGHGEKVVFSGETTLHPRVSSEYLALNDAVGFNLLGHFSDFSGLVFSSTRLSGNVFVFEAPV